MEQPGVLDNNNVCNLDEYRQREVYRKNYEDFLDVVSATLHKGGTLKDITKMFTPVKNHYAFNSIKDRWISLLIDEDEEIDDSVLEDEITISIIELRAMAQAVEDIDACNSYDLLMRVRLGALLNDVGDSLKTVQGWHDIIKELNDMQHAAICDDDGATVIPLRKP